jgi:hypothetical protein
MCRRSPAGGAGERWWEGVEGESPPWSDLAESILGLHVALIFK